MFHAPRRKKIIPFNQILTLFLCVFFSSCIGFKPGGAKSGKKLYEDFFVGNETTQYFIKPLKFSGSGDETMDLDITFRYNKEMKDSAVMNFSFYLKEPLKSIDSLILRNDRITLHLSSIRFLFVDRKGSALKCRFTGKAGVADLDSLFLNDKWSVSLFQNNLSVNYATPSGTQRKINKLNYAIFSLM